MDFLRNERLKSKINSYLPRTALKHIQSKYCVAKGAGSSEQLRNLVFTLHIEVELSATKMQVSSYDNSFDLIVSKHRVMKLSGVWQELQGLKIPKYLLLGQFIIN